LVTPNFPTNAKRIITTNKGAQAEIVCRKLSGMSLNKLRI